MTREEREDAINFFKEVAKREVGTYCKLAIEALEKKTCGDAISREDALMTLTGDITDCTIEEYIARLRDKLSKLPLVTPKEKTGWIPVSERLPETNVEVLVTTEWDCITIGEMFSSNDWFIHEGATNADIDDIKAWMPLPEPYKAESEG
jgi:hypothetical protein